MIKVRTFVIALAISLPLAMVAQTEAPPAQAQGQTQEHRGHMGRMGEPPSPQQHLDHLSRMLNLTDDQKAKILPILQNSDTQMKTLRQDTSLSPQDRHAKMRDLHQSTMSQIRALLTPEQQAKVDQMKERREGKGMGHREGMGPGSEKQQAPPAPPQD